MKKSFICKAIGSALCAALVVAALAGCQGSGGATDQTGDTQGEHEPITILTGNQKYEAFAELLEERYPEVNLKFVSFAGGDVSNYMRASLEQGTIPDIYAITYVPDGEEQKEHLLDLADNGIVNEYADTMLNSLNVDGGIYLLPSRYALLGIVYNKTLMEENGWEVPESFEEMKALEPQIEAAGYKAATMKTSLTGTTFGTFFALGNTNFFGTPAGAQWKLDYLKGDAEAVGSLEEVKDYFQEWIDAGFIDTYDYDHPEERAEDEFDTRKSVFYIYSNRFTPEIGTDEYGFMPFLSEDGTNNMLVRLVSRYYGLNKELGEAGNEQKLEDALKVFELMATEEGQEALSGGSSAYIASTSINDLPEDSPYKEVLDLINRGNMVDMVYGGWERHIVPLIENYGNDWINGKITGEEFLEGMDTLNEELLAGVGQEILGTVEEAISLEDTAKLCAIAEGNAAGADAALISLPAFHGFAEGANLENTEGVHCGIFFTGELEKGETNMFAPNKGTILTVRMTGSEIKELAGKGFLKEGDPTPFDYYLVTKDGMELVDDEEYTLAISSPELTDAEVLEKAEDTELTPLSVVCDYIKELGTVSAETIVWE